MTDTQVEYASVIHSSGNDLLELLNSILDLAKVESGTVTAEMSDVSVAELRSALLREFEHVAQGKGIDFSIDLAPDGLEHIVTDPQRLRQILKNLLSNAFKFTEHGQVQMRIGLADHGWSPEMEPLVDASSVVAFSVSDSGIGIERAQQQRIFEAFAQGDGTTARLYGGTGLGLSISRELVGLLGGEITVASTPGQGSTFTVYLPSGGRATVTPAIRPRVIPAAERPSSLVAPDEPAENRGSGRPTPSSGEPHRGYEDPARRRRLPEPLRVVGAPRTGTRRGRRGREWSGGDRDPRADARHRRRPDGHHDAGHGRLRDLDRHSRDGSLQGPPDDRGHRQGRGR